MDDLDFDTTSHPAARTVTGYVIVPKVLTTATRLDRIGPGQMWYLPEARREGGNDPDMCGAIAFVPRATKECDHEDCDHAEKPFPVYCTRIRDHAKDHAAHSDGWQIARWEQDPDTLEADRDVGDALHTYVNALNPLGGMLGGIVGKIVLGGDDD